MRIGRTWTLPLAVMAALVVTGWSSSPAAARTLCVGKETILLRGGPSSRHNPVGSLPAGACGIQVVGKCVSGWCDVALGTRRGWVDSRLVNVQEGGAAAAPAPQRTEPPPPRQAAPAPPPRPAPPATTGATADRESHCVMGVRQGDTLRIRTGPSAECLRRDRRQSLFGLLVPRDLSRHPRLVERDLSPPALDAVRPQFPLSPRAGRGPRLRRAFSTT